MTPDPALRVEGLTVNFGPRPALRELDLEVGRGEMVALAGPNGSGKTTLLRAVLGLLPLDAGSIEILGTPLATLPIRERARRVAWVPQEEGARDNVRLVDYVQYGRYAHRDAWSGDLESDRTAVERALASSGLADRAGDGILTLSGGERQRATLARALAQDAPILLLDEPTSHLDIAHQLDFLGRVRDLARSGEVTVIAALHDLNLAARFTDRVVVLSRGRRVADGPPVDILSEELLLRVWGVVAERRVEPRTGVPYLIPQRLVAPPRPIAALAGWGPVHVVGGAGAAAPILRLLADEGARVTVGTLNLLDSDAQIAEQLGVPSAIEVPFAPLGTEARQRNAQLLGAARAIVVAAFPVGPSNLANLEDVTPFVGRVPVFLAGEPPIASRDWTGGGATEAWERLRAAGATVFHTPAELMAGLRTSARGPVGGADAPERADVE